MTEAEKNANKDLFEQDENESSNLTLESVLSTSEQNDEFNSFAQVITSKKRELEEKDARGEEVTKEPKLSKKEEEEEKDNMESENEDSPSSKKKFSSPKIDSMDDESDEEKEKFNSNIVNPGRNLASEKLIFDLTPIEEVLLNFNHCSKI